MKTGYMQEFTEHKDIATERGERERGIGREKERESRNRDRNPPDLGTYWDTIVMVPIL